MPAERLQKIIAQRGAHSRRAAERLIREGRVRVGGEVAALGRRADPEADAITIDGGALPERPPPLTLMLHKPRGVVVTASDERGRATVFGLLDDPPPGLRQVGRLDRDSEGLLLLTTRGELAHRLTHPRYRVGKTYEALVEGVPPPEALARLRAGVELDDGPAAPAEAALLRRAGGGAWLRLTLREGRTRQARRMLAAVGHPVRRLIRTRLGGLALGALPTGASRPLTAGEERALRALAGLDGGSLDAAETRSISSDGAGGAVRADREAPDARRPRRRRPRP